LALYSFAVVILEYASRSVDWRADNYITKTYVAVRAWCTTSNPNHKTAPKVWKTADHVANDACSLRDSIFPKRQSRDHNLMTPYGSSGIHIVVLHGSVGR
jgi:hypothetical protein